MSGPICFLQHNLSPLHVKCHGIWLAKAAGGAVEFTAVILGMAMGRLIEELLTFLAEEAAYIWEPIYKRLPWLGWRRRKI